MLSLLNKTLINHPNEAPFHVLSGDVYFQLNDSKKALMPTKIIKFWVTDFLIWNRYLILGLELQEYDRVYKTDEAIELHPIHQRFICFRVCRIL